MFKGQDRIEMRNGSMRIGTNHKAEKLAVIRYWLYLCSAFETQMLEVKY